MTSRRPIPDPGAPPSPTTAARPAVPLAARADRYRLYELAVQSPESEVDFLDASFQMLRGRRAGLMREDFCGTAQLCCEWVRKRSGNRAIGVDLDAGVLDWARSHNLARLDPSRRNRVDLRLADVLTAHTEPVDLVVAMNFSYCAIRERTVLRDYLVRVRDTLTEDGVLFLDAYGGSDAFRVFSERRPVRGDFGPFTYVWEQEAYDPISGRLSCHIHFELPDGSRLEKAFSYDWRLWTLPEIRDLLQEVGFTHVLTYWQGRDGEGEPDGRFAPVEVAEAEASWVCYLSAAR